MALHISTDATPAAEDRVPARRTVQDVMTPQPLTIGRRESLVTAREMMRAHGCGHLPVLEHGELVGMVTKRDLDLLADTGVDLDADRANREVARQMATERYGCAVIIERGRVIGIFTTTDALRVLADSAL